MEIPAAFPAFGSPNRGCCMIRAVVMGMVVGLVGVASSPAEAGPFDRPQRVRLTRGEQLAAWRRLRELKIPGVPDDRRFAVHGKVRYVSPSGDDGAAGTQDRPWRTLAHACSRLEPGMVVRLAAGTYYGPVTVKVQATEDAPAAIRAEDGAEVIVTYPEDWIAARAAELVSVEPGPDIRKRALGKDGEAKHYPPLLSCSGTFVEISGLHFVGVRHRLPHNLYSENGVSLSGGHGCRVLHNEVENVGHCGVKAMHHGEHDYLVEGNFLHDLGHTGHDHGIYCPSDRGLLRRNLILNTSGYGIHAYSKPKGMVITHNILGGNEAFGIILGGPDARVYHNVLYRNRGGGVFLFRSGCVGAQIRNNLFFQPKRPIGVDHTPSGNVVDYNNFSPDSGQVPPSPAYDVGDHNLRADPGVVAAERLDFTLTDRSPCIDAGDPALGPCRGKAPDIGIYEAPAD